MEIDAEFEVLKKRMTIMETDMALPRAMNLLAGLGNPPITS